MLRIAVGDEMVREPASFDDASVFVGVARAVRRSQGGHPALARHRRVRRHFLHRIALVIEALGEAWARHPTMTFGQLLTRRSTGETGHG